MVKTTAIHASKLSTSGDDEKVSLQNKHADSLISVTLAEHEGSDADLGGASLHTTDNITMQFPDDTEIAKSSLGATQEISLAQAEAGKQNNKSEVIVLNHVDITQKQPIIEADKLQSGKESSYIRDTEAGQVQLQEDIPSTPVTTQFPENEDTPKPSTHRTSKVRFDMDQIATQSLQILSIDTPNEQDEDEDEGNYYTSGSESSMPHPHIEAHSLEAELERSLQTSRRESEGSSESDSELVDWQELDRTEEEEKRDGATGESMAFLLARLEKENNALAIDPKANLTHGRSRSTSRPPSLHMIKKLVNEPTKPQLRYSLLPTPPPMTELEFWSALVRDYPTTAQRLPTLTSNKIRSGIPPPLRGVVWQSIAGARDPILEDEYVRLSVESSPYEKMIHKDVGRSFPGVDMFRDPNGHGQRMLSKVLNAFSLWDQEIGYCQGLGFVVGPLLMHMGDKEAFCVLVRLMEHYDLRSCFLPSLRGLHLRIYQFQNLLSQHLPELTAHLEQLKVEPLYLSQWFLSFFGVTCPLPMLIRIYDVILTEGASETLMRVALSLMRRNAPKILATVEFEDIMHLLLSRNLWDTYGCNADDLVDDFVGWTGLVTREGLESLETSFKEREQSDADKPGIHNAASRFLGRFWTGSNMPGKTIAAPTLSLPIRNSHMERSPSKQSMASTLSSFESSEAHQSHVSTLTTATSISQDMNAEEFPAKQTLSQNMAPNTRSGAHQDKDLHGQIEDLLIALSNLQREHSTLSDHLQQEIEQREEDKAAVIRALDCLKNEKPSKAKDEENDVAGFTEDTYDPLEVLDDNINTAVSELETQFTSNNKRSSLALQTKQQLREDASRWKILQNEEVIRTATLTAQLNEKDRETAQLSDELRQARSRIADSHREQQRLEKVNRELKSRRSTTDDNYQASLVESPRGTSPTHGLREFRLGRNSASSSLAMLQPTYSRRGSSLINKDLPVSQDPKPPAEDTLLHELVNAKTAEAVARQELEEVKAKLDALRKMLNVSTSSGSSHAHNASIVSFKSIPIPAPAKQEPKKDTSTPSSYTAAAGFFSGWGKRAVS